MVAVPSELHDRGGDRPDGIYASVGTIIILRTGNQGAYRRLSGSRGMISRATSLHPVSCTSPPTAYALGKNSGPAVIESVASEWTIHRSSATGEFEKTYPPI